MTRYKYTVVGDKIIYEPQRYQRPPQLHPGYRRDKNDPWVQISDWQPCKHRILNHKPRAKCGRALTTMKCGCESCPVFNMIVKPDTCDFCEHAE